MFSNHSRKSLTKHGPLLALICLFIFIIYSRYNSINHIPVDNIDGKEGGDNDRIEVKVQPNDRIDDDDHEESKVQNENELDCPALPFRFLDGKGSIVQLASFPGSGNTWIRHLLQRGSGVLTGSVYDDKSLYLEFPGESVRDSTVIAVKTHYPCEACWNVGPEKKTPAREIQTGVIRDYKATIQVLRSPFGAILSDFNHKLSGANHTGLATREQFESQIFDDFVLLRMKIWTRHATYYLNSKGEGDNIWLDMKGRPVLLIYYEDLKKDTVAQMQKIFSFIKKYSPRDRYLVKLNALEAAKCSISQDAIGGFKRSAPKTKPFEKVGQDGRTFRETVCDYVRDRCKSFWKKDDPEWNCT